MTLGEKPMPVVRLHVRRQDWERVEWRQQFELELEKAGWRVRSIEPPTSERPEYVYVLER